MNWFGFLKKGKHIDSKGRPFDATDEKLNKILEVNKGREIPIAIGHPATDSPAWGWVAQLKRMGDELLALPRELVAEFEAMLKKEMFKTVSVALNPDLTIRHIGFLGSTPPAIEGLTQFKFSSAEDEIIFEFAAPGTDKPAKPAEYAHIPDSEFADPKNYKYPIDQAHIHAAMSYWAMQKNREGYGADEVKTITGRILAAAKKYGIAVDESKWQFSISNHKEVQEMKKLLALLGLTETATEDDAIAAVNTIKTSANAVFASKAVLDALELKSEDATEAGVVGLIKTFSLSHSKVIELQKENEKLDKELKDRDAEEIVRFARTKGKIRHEQETWALEYAKKDIDGFREYVNKASVVLDEEFTPKDGHAFIAPGSDVDLQVVQDISAKALEFQAAAEKRGQVVTITEAVRSVVKKKR